MPSFIDNTGHQRVASLMTLAVVNDAMTHCNKSNQSMPSTLGKLLDERRLKIGVRKIRTVGEIPVYVAEDRTMDLTDNPPWVDWTSREGKTFHHIRPQAKKTKRSSKAGPKTIAKIKVFLSSLKVATVKLIISEGGDGFKFYKCDFNSGILVIDDHSTLRRLGQDEVDLPPVNKLKITYYLGNDSLNLLYYFHWFPYLKSLELRFSDNSLAWKPLSLFHDQLHELHVKVLEFDYRAIIDLFDNVGQLHQLRVLSITNSPGSSDDGAVGSQNLLSSLSRLEGLLSLTITGVSGIISHDVIQFLLAEVRHGRETVQRQDLMSDITLINISTVNVEAILLSNDLCPSIKTRIFCDGNLNKVSATVALLLKRGNDEPIEEIFVNGTASFDRRGLYEDDTPYPMFLQVIFEAVKFEPEKKHLYSGWVCQLLGTDGKVQHYSAEVMSAATAHFGRILNKRVLRHSRKVITVHDLQDIVNVLYILDRHLESPHDIPAYLAMLVNIMDHSSKKCDMAALFLRQAKKLHLIELADFIDNHKKQLTCAAMQFLIDYPSRGFATLRTLPKTTNISAEMVEMFSLIKKYTSDDDLKIAIEALLQASRSASSNILQGVSSFDRRQEEEAHRVAAPLLAPGRSYNHLYWQEKHCVPDIKQAWQKKMLADKYALFTENRQVREGRE